MINPESKALLVQSGIDFQLLKQHGIDPLYLGEKLIASGLFFNDTLTWICFHGCSDMGYLYKILTNDKMPHRDQFKETLRVFFPKLLDIKTLQEYYHVNLRGGLSAISQRFGLTREEGEMH